MRCSANRGFMPAPQSASPACRKAPPSKSMPFFPSIERGMAATKRPDGKSPLIAMRGVSKRFGAVIANDDVYLDVFPGEVLALLGENGAGKSTLMRLLYGLYTPDDGRIAIAGKDVRFDSPGDAMAAGIGMVFQQFSLLPNLSVLENLLVASPKAPWWQGRGRRAMDDITVWLRRLAPNIDPGRRISDLAVGERQIVELAKVLNL